MEAKIIGPIEGIQGTALRCSEKQVLLVGTIDHPRFECCERIDAAYPQCMNKVPGDRVFVEIKLDLRHASG